MSDRELEVQVICAARDLVSAFKDHLAIGDSRMPGIPADAFDWTCSKNSAVAEVARCSAELIRSVDAMDAP